MMQQSVDGLSHNFNTRVIDLSAWSGISLALAVAGGPSRMKLLSPETWGAIQAVSLVFSNRTNVMKMNEQ